MADSFLDELESKLDEVGKVEKTDDIILESENIKATKKLKSNPKDVGASLTKGLVSGESNEALDDLSHLVNSVGSRGARSQRKNSSLDLLESDSQRNFEDDLDNLLANKKPKHNRSGATQPRTTGLEKKEVEKLIQAYMKKIVVKMSDQYQVSIDELFEENQVLRETIGELSTEIELLKQSKQKILNNVNVLVKDYKARKQR